jgi:hypothetical protein
MAARAVLANRSPISASSGGAGLWRQLDGNRFGAPPPLLLHGQ